eukprot:m51a1_g7835 hypothetical protein (112) ;mRNA; f:175659-176123
MSSDATTTQGQGELAPLSSRRPEKLSAHLSMVVVFLQQNSPATLKGITDATGINRRRVYDILNVLCVVPSREAPLVRKVKSSGQPALFYFLGPASTAEFGVGSSHGGLRRH